MKNYLSTLMKKAGISLVSGVFLIVGIMATLFVVQAFQGPTGGDTDPTTAGYTSAGSWISTTLTAIKSKTDTITTGSSYCDPNSGKYCNIKPTCDGTEASVVVDASRGTGYCIEKSERAAQTWELAKMTCEALGKRLPEPFEWKYGCKNDVALGLANMTSPATWEWASNTTLQMYGSTYAGVSSAIFGAGGCAYASWNWLGYSVSSESSHNFRCVR